MATVCGGSMALIDAQVPIKEPVAGVAIGLITETDESGKITEDVVLTDILGIEDYLGDMDFKIAGTTGGMTALQMDLKLSRGLPLDVVRKAVVAGHQAKKTILGIMNRHLNEKQKRPLRNHPKTELIEVPPSKRQNLLGPGGFRLKKLEAETGSSLTQLDEFKWQLFSPSETAFEEAKILLDELLQEEKNILEKLEFGAIYPATIVELKERGIMVELQPGMTPVYVPNGQLDTRKVNHPSMLGLEMGQEIHLKYFGRDPSTGAMRLSRKVLQATTTAHRLTQ
jgi:polyribonucleotide nucleotidyltransferase